MHGQINELTTNYGKIDIMWFDYSFPGYYGEKWKAKELVKMVRANQPDIILNNRLEENAGVAGAARTMNEFGDFETPEQGIPENPLTDKYNNPVPWETCLTMNGVWGYSELDKNWKSPELIIHSLVNCVSKNGNFLLNVGPDPRGNFPVDCLNILSEVGKWMEKNSESIYGCGAGVLKRQDWGRYTQKGNNIYLHWLYPVLGNLNAKGINSDAVKNVFMLHSGAELSTYKTWFGDKASDNLFIRTGASPQKPYPYDTVVKIEMKE
jgi:alpha-L-fucosidase